MADPYTEVRDYVQRRVGSAGGCAPTAGSPEWCALQDTDQTKLLAVLSAGVAWVLEQEIDQLARRREAQKDMALGLLETLPWAQLVRRIEQRDAFYQRNPDLMRRKVS